MSTVYAERVCARDKETKFVPTTGVQKACGVCAKCEAAKPKAVKARPKGKPSRIRPPGAPKSTPVLPRNTGGLDAAAWLKLGGFKVEVVNAPSGAWFRMVG